MSHREQMRRDLVDAAGRLDVDMRPLTRDDLVACHKTLDELNVPRLCDAGLPLSLRWRLIALKYQRQEVAS